MWLSVRTAVVNLQLINISLLNQLKLAAAGCLPWVLAIYKLDGQLTTPSRPWDQGLWNGSSREMVSYRCSTEMGPGADWPVLTAAVQ